ncbi:MAG: M6 family metalloprotease domain-containing protein [Bacteroidales bacterium]|nr:M6 family metalloprotease domain-containing protein [Bacteroidales bacterium]
MRRFLSAAFFLFSVMALAVPAKRVKRIITLPDGSQKEVVLSGDEHVHFYLDADGNTYEQRSDYEFIKVDKKELLDRWQQRLSLRNATRARRAAARKAKWGSASNPISGSKKGLVILVNFSDKSMTPAHNLSYFNDYFNLEGFSQDDMAGSVHDYFKECSYGQFDLTFDVVGPVTVSKSMSYYGKNNSVGDDMHPGELVIEACRLADEKGVDFSTYDWDGDGYVDQVYVLYAGYGENAGASSNTIWPHECDLTTEEMYGDGTGPVFLDGVMIDTYAVSSELAGSRGTRVSGIGTACHEFSHCMCIPDLYDINYSLFGMNSWDIMDCGSYNGKLDDGECPAAFTSYERMYCGWLTPTVLSDPCQVSLKPLNTNAEAYIIYNPANHNEYYLLENHQQQGFSTYDAAHGMLILHVDFDKKSWEENTVNVMPGHERLTIIPADNSRSERNLYGDTWPGTKQNTSLTDTTTPAATLYNRNTNGRKFLGKPITDIAENDGIVSFTFDGGVPSAVPWLKTTNGDEEVELGKVRIYDLNGRVTEQPPLHGIHIVNGRKVLK